VREYSEISHPIKTDEQGYNLKLGFNSPINFKFSGYAATIVGTGVEGVGDKEGSKSEQSIGYENLTIKYGELS